MEAVLCDNCGCQIAAADAATRGDNGKLYCAKCAPRETKTGDYAPVKSPAKFYFCETCGKRVTDVDIESGVGRNKKLKGIYCKDCAVGVMTIEFDAIQEAPAGKPTPSNLPSERPPSSSAKKASASGLIPARRSAGPSESKPSGRFQAHSAKSEKARQAAPALAILVAVGVAVLLLAFLAMGNSQESVSPKSSISKNTADPIQFPSREPAAVESRPVLSSHENSTSHPLPDAQRVEQPVPSLQGTDTEAQAAQAVDKLMKSEDDKATRVAAIEQFLKTYGDTIVAARARLLLSEMTNSDAPVRPGGTPERSNQVNTDPKLAHVQNTDSPQITQLSQPSGEFKAIVDPKTLVGIDKAALNGWRSTGSAIENIPGVDNSAKITGAYGDGEYHIRFSTENARSLYFKVRLSSSGSNEVRFDGARMKPLQGKVHDLNIICQGAQASAKLDGNEVSVTTKGSPADGNMMFNTSGGKLKIYCIEWRKLDR